MYRQNNKRFFSQKFALALCLLWTIFLPTSGFAGNMADKIELRMEKNKEYAENEYLLSDTINVAIFKSNIANRENEKRKELTKGIEATQWFLQQEFPNCRMSTQEISNLLYFSNKHFKDLILSMNEEGEKVEIPRQKDYENSCKKISTCIKGESVRFINTVCKSTISNYYDNGRKKEEQENKILHANLGEDKYRNGNRKDAEYDLLFDISRIGMVFFKGFKKNPEFAFYQAPNFNKKGEKENQEKNKKSAAKNHTKTAAENRTRANTRSSSSKEENPSRSRQEIEQTLQSTNTQQSQKQQDSELQNFINKHSNQEEGEGGELFMNFCNYERPGTNIKNYPEAPQTKKENSQQYADPHKDPELTVEKIDQQIEIIMKTNPKTEIKKIDPKKAPRTKLPKDEKEFNNIRKNLEKCTDRCNDFAIDEMLVCKMSCLCIEVHSPALEKNRRFPILDEGAFMIRMCSIPSESKSPNTTAKNLISIEEIFNEIFSVAEDLYKGGELTTKVRTKEFLDTGMKKLKFDDQTNIIININQKKIKDKDNEKLKEAINYERNLKLLQAEKKAGKKYKEEETKNIYVISGRYNIDQQKGGQINKTTTPESKRELSNPIIASEEHSQRQKFIGINYQMLIFIEKNIDLLERINDSLLEYMAIINALSEKKNS